jgi:uncharacterized membrane protein
MTRFSQTTKIALAAFVYALPGYLIFEFCTHWLHDRTVVSYEDGFSTYLVRERFALHALTAIVALLAALTYRPTWRIGLISAVVGALMFRLTDLWVYSHLSSRWEQYRDGVFVTILTTVLIGVAFGFLAVCRQLRGKNAA